MIIDEQWQADTMFYIIQIEDRGRSWTTRKRFRDFERLDVDLGYDRSGLSTLHLPPKGCFGFRHRFNICGFNDSRRRSLSEYLSHLAEQLQSAAENAIMARFLHCDSVTSSDLSRCCEDSGSVVANTSTAVELSGSPCALAPEKVVAEPKKELRVAQQLPNFHAHIDPADLCGAEWEAFQVSHSSLAATLRQCALMCSKPSSFQNGSETVWKALRTGLHGLSKNPEEMQAIPCKAVVWDFLILLAARRPFYRAQVREIVKMLERFEVWSDALHEHQDLYELRQELIPEPQHS